MFLQLSADMSRVAFKIEAWGRRLLDWSELEMAIEDASLCENPRCRHVGGSPWVLTGCWPGKWTDIDIANFRPHDLPDYHTIIIPAYGLDLEGRIVFRLTDEFKRMPHGRYIGSIRVRPACEPVDMALPLSKMIHIPRVGDRKIPPEFDSCCGSYPLAVPMDYGPKHAPPPSSIGSWPPPPRRPKPKCCVLATFDIDYGPGCSDHIVKDVVADFGHPTGGVEDGDS